MSIIKSKLNYHAWESLRKERIKSIKGTQWSNVFLLRTPADESIDNQFYYFDDDYINTNDVYYKHIGKYVSWLHLEDVFSKGFYFQEPSQWKDDFEKRFYCADYTKILSPHLTDKYTPRLYACCFTYGFETEAAWNTYGNTTIKNDKQPQREFVVRLEINRENLLSELNNWARNNNFFVYDGYVNYKYPLHLLKSIHNSDQRENPLWFEDFTLQNYLSLLLQKRKAYYNEMEERVFLISNGLHPIQINISVKVDMSKLIDKIILGPQTTLDDETSVKILCHKHGINPIVCKSELNKNDIETQEQIAIEKASLTNPWTKKNLRYD